MAEPHGEVMERKLALQRQFLRDLETYAALGLDARRREHYAIERLLQLLCESAADIALQVLKARGLGIASSYREVFESLAQHGDLPDELARRLVAACSMRNLLTHLYDVIDLDRVVEAVDPAVALYREFGTWARHVIGENERPSG